MWRPDELVGWSWLSENHQVNENTELAPACVSWLGGRIAGQRDSGPALRPSPGRVVLSSVLSCSRPGVSQFRASLYVPRVFELVHA